MNRYHPIIFLLGIILGSATLMADAKPVTLTGNHFRYREDLKQLVISGNATLKMGDATISADRLKIDTLSNVLIATQNVSVRRGDDHFETPVMFMDLDQEKISISDVHIAVQPPDSKAPLFLHAARLEDYPKNKKGYNGLLTSCDLDHPHYFIWAQHFDYVPEQRLIGYNVFIYTPIMFIPFGLYTPFYWYELGERRVVWNFPTIGRKETPGWGWFVQNAIDYAVVDKRESSLYIDWYENKGIGYGIQHQYGNEESPGTLYYYRLEEADTGKLNEKYRLNHTWKIYDPLTINVDVSKIDAEKINASSRQREEAKSFQATYDDLGDRYFVKTGEDQNVNQRLKNQSFSYERTYNQRKEQSFGFSKNQNFFNNRQFLTGSFINNLRFGKNTEFTQSFSYFNEDFWTDNKDPDEKLISKLTYNQTFDNGIKLNINVDHLYDIDQGRFAEDNESAKNNHFYKLPEIILSYHNSDFYGMSLRESLTIGRYQEITYDAGTKKQRIFPFHEEFSSVVPNTYIFKQHLSKTYANLPGKSTFTTSIGHDQYIFYTNRDKSIFENDAMNFLIFDTSYTSDPLDFFKTKTSYSSSYAPAENNSPFFQFNAATSPKNEVAQELDFYLISPSKYAWKNRTSYSWILNAWRNYETQIIINPVPAFRSSLKTGKVLSPKPSDISRRFLPLELDINGSPSANINIRYRLALDLTKWVDENIRKVNDSYVNIDFNLGGNPKYKWVISTLFRYNTFNQGDEIDGNRYELQTVGITKHEHERTLRFDYVKQREEFRFKYTINAFPNDAIGFKQTRDIWKLEGILDERTKERF